MSDEVKKLFEGAARVATEYMRKNKMVRLRPKKGTPKHVRAWLKQVEYELNSPENKEKVNRAYQELVINGTGRTETDGYEPNQ